MAFGDSLDAAGADAVSTLGKVFDLQLLKHYGPSSSTQTAKPVDHTMGYVAIGVAVVVVLVLLVVAFRSK